MKEEHEKWNKEGGTELIVSEVRKHPNFAKLQQIATKMNAFHSRMMTATIDAGNELQLQLKSLGFSLPDLETPDSNKQNKSTGVLTCDDALDKASNSVVNLKFELFEPPEIPQPVWPKVHDSINLDFVINGYGLKDNVMHYVPKLLEERTSLSELLEKEWRSQTVSTEDLELFGKFSRSDAVASLNEKEIEKAKEVVPKMLCLTHCKASGFLSTRTAVLSKLTRDFESISTLTRTAHEERSDRAETLWRCLFCFTVNKWKFNFMFGFKQKKSSFNVAQFNHQGFNIIGQTFPQEVLKKVFARSFHGVREGLSKKDFITLDQ